MSILSHARTPGHDPHVSVGGRVRVSGSTTPIRLVIPVDVIGDEFPPAAADTRGGHDFAAARALLQRTEWHVDVPDEDLTALAVRAVYPRRPLWRRLVTRIGGAR